MKPKAIIFDFDGTIVSTEKLHYQALEKALAEVGMELSYQEFAENYFGVPDVILLPELFKRRDKTLTAEIAEQVLRSKKAIYLTLDAHALNAYPGMLKFMQMISDHMPMAICTGAHRQDIDLVLPILENGKIFPLMQHIVTADDVTNTKPHPESYLLVADRLGVAPQDCLVFEDTATGIQSAKMAGMYVVALTHTNPREKLQHADEIIDTIIGYEKNLLL